MNTERIKEIQQETAYPESRSVQQALLKVWNECEQSKGKGQVDAIVNCLWVPIMWINDNPVLDSAKYFNTKEEALEFIDSHKIKASNVVQWTIPRIEKGN